MQLSTGAKGFTTITLSKGTRIPARVSLEKGSRDPLHREPLGSSPLLWSCPVLFRRGERSVASGNDPLGKGRRCARGAPPPERPARVPPGPVVGHRAPPTEGQALLLELLLPMGAQGAPCSSPLLMPRPGSCQRMPAPTSIPKPVSASPASWRMAISREGRRDDPCAKGKGRVDSRPRRSRENTALGGLKALHLFRGGV